MTTEADDEVVVALDDPRVGEFKWWGTVIGRLVGVFVLSATITNILHTIFGFQLLPIFQNNLEGFHAFMHLMLDLLVFSWLKPLLAWAWYGLTWAISQFAGVSPHFPTIVIPGWYKDMSLVSGAFAAAGLRATNFVPWESTYNAASHRRVRENTGLLGLTIFLTLQIVETNVRHVGWRIQWAVEEIVGSLTKISAIREFFGNLVYVTYRGVTLSGLLLLFVRTVELVIGGPSANMRAYVRWQYISLGVALVASGAFFVWNGYAMGTGS